MLVSGGMMNVAVVVLGSVVVSSSGRSSLHLGSSFILLSCCSYLSRPCWQRKFESLMSLVCGSWSFCDSSPMLCHVPSLISVKNSSTLIPFDYLCCCVSGISVEKNVGYCLSIVWFLYFLTRFL